jgi:adenosine deaminase
MPTNNHRTRKSLCPQLPRRDFRQLPLLSIECLRHLICVERMSQQNEQLQESLNAEKLAAQNAIYSELQSSRTSSQHRQAVQSQFEEVVRGLKATHTRHAELNTQKVITFEAQSQAKEFGLQSKLHTYTVSMQ